jgi:osmotically-inducible protein OsmY
MICPASDADGICSDSHRVAEAARRLLQQCAYPVVRRVECRYYDGVLTLTGNVPTFHMKQVAQTAVRDMNQVDRIDNRLEVPPAGRDTRSGRTPGALV